MKKTKNKKPRYKIGKKTLKQLIIISPIVIPLVALTSLGVYSRGNLQPASISFDTQPTSNAVLSTLTSINDSVLPIFGQRVLPETLLYTMPPDMNAAGMTGGGFSNTAVKRASLRYTHGSRNRIFYGTKYSSADFLFARDCKVGNWTPMLDVRGHYFNNGQYATNLGFVGRYIKSDLSTMYGANIFWDHRRGKRGNYNGLGLGVEAFGHKWDFRANGYFPFGETQHREKCVFDEFEGGFFAIVRKKEVALYGGNMEVGYTMLSKSNNAMLYIAAGPYYFNGGCELNIKGGEIRFHPQYKDYLSLDIMVSFDNTYHTTVQGQVAVTLPLYDIKGGRNCGYSKRVVYQPVERFEVMQIGRCCCWDANFD